MLTKTRSEWPVAAKKCFIFRVCRLHKVFFYNIALELQPRKCQLPLELLSQIEIYKKYPKLCVHSLKVAEQKHQKERRIPASLARSPSLLSFKRSLKTRNTTSTLLSRLLTFRQRFFKILIVINISITTGTKKRHKACFVPLSEEQTQKG